MKLKNYEGQKIDSNSEEEYSAEFNATNSKESNEDNNHEENVSEENLDNLNNHHKHHWHHKQGNYKKNK